MTNCATTGRVAWLCNIHENDGVPAHDEIMEVLGQGYTLITPTRRLSRYFQHQYALRQLQAGNKTWPTPDVLPWNGWLQKTWNELALERDLAQLLLGAHQQLLIWREIIRKSAHGKYILQPATTARQAMHAWSLCRQWQIPVFADDIYLNGDALAFRQWAGAYTQRCEQNGWIDEASLSAIIAGMGAGTAGKKNIALAGFDELTPVQQAVIAKLRATGCKVQELELLPCNEKTIAVGLNVCRDEIRAAACWARELLEAQPSCSIGIVVQDLQTLYADMHAVFDDVFFPGAILVDTEDPQRPYALARGRPLAHYPVIDTALLVLGLGNKDIALEEIGHLLRSPFIRKAAAEGQQRARMDACLRQHGEYRINFNTLQWLVKHEYLNAGDVPVCFIECWQKYLDLLRGHDHKQSAGNWAKLFANLLHTFGWPGDRSLSSAEYQTVVEWQNQLQRFAALDLVAPSLSAGDAWSLLRQLLLGTAFQPETPEVPIQILGMSGAAAMHFDHLWIMGLHAEVWPGKAEPHPFIPLKLQRALGMPGATPEIKLKEARRLTQCLISSSPDVVLSYPRNEKERELRPSPLIKMHQVQPDEHVYAGASHYAALIHNDRRMEEIEDPTAPAIPRGAIVSGGATLFKDQAACPFRAFARHRLFAQALDNRDIGLDAMARGSLVHAVMEKLWSRLGSSENLAGMPTEQLDEIIAATVRNAVNAARKQLPLTFTERFMQLEADRLSSMVRNLLVIERERMLFTVQHCEYRHRFNFNEITINTRIDRIDQLADGRYVIMDYKTGDPKISQWFSDRPDEPQLPLYAITTGGQLAAIVFTRLQKDNVGFIGLAQEDGILPDVKTVADTRQARDIPDWKSLLQQWRQTLDQLARRFRDGHAAVDPKDAVTCRYCDLHALCRIYERDTRYEIRDTEHE